MAEEGLRRLPTCARFVLAFNAHRQTNDYFTTFMVIDESGVDFETASSLVLPRYFIIRPGVQSRQAHLIDATFMTREFENPPSYAWSSSFLGEEQEEVHQTIMDNSSRGTATPINPRSTSAQAERRGLSLESSSQDGASNTNVNNRSIFRPFTGTIDTRSEWTIIPNQTNVANQSPRNGRTNVTQSASTSDHQQTTQNPNRVPDRRSQARRSVYSNALSEASPSSAYETSNLPGANSDGVSHWVGIRNARASDSPAFFVPIHAVQEQIRDLNSVLGELASREEETERFLSVCENNINAAAQDGHAGLPAILTRSVRRMMNRGRVKRLTKRLLFIRRCKQWTENEMQELEQLLSSATTAHMAPTENTTTPRTTWVPQNGRRMMVIPAYLDIMSRQESEANSAAISGAFEAFMNRRPRTYGSDELHTKNGQTHNCCSICLCEIEPEEGRWLPCAHVFHETCIDLWLRVKNECPLCKVSPEPSGTTLYENDEDS